MTNFNWQLTYIRYKLVLLYSWGGQNLDLETKGKISLVVIFMQLFVTKRKLSLSFTETLLFPDKTTSFLNNSHNAYQNADGNWKFNITELNLWKSTFWKQSVISKDEIKVSVILANKSEVQAKNFIILISFYGY